jgi:hypothetical protein
MLGQVDGTGAHKLSPKHKASKGIFALPIFATGRQDCLTMGEFSPSFV